jgi:hypothetical protein
MTADCLPHQVLGALRTHPADASVQQRGLEALGCM